MACGADVFNLQVQAEANATYNATAYAEATYTAWCPVASAVVRCASPLWWMDYILYQVATIGNYETGL